MPITKHENVKKTRNINFCTKNTNYQLKNRKHIFLPFKLTSDICEKEEKEEEEEEEEEKEEKKEKREKKKKKTSLCRRKHIITLTKRDSL